MDQVIYAKLWSAESPHTKSAVMFHLTDRQLDKRTDWLKFGLYSRFTPTQNKEEILGFKEPTEGKMFENQCKKMEEKKMFVFHKQIYLHIIYKYTKQRVKQGQMWSLSSVAILWIYRKNNTMEILIMQNSDKINSQ